MVAGFRAILVYSPNADWNGHAAGRAGSSGSPVVHYRCAVAGSLCWQRQGAGLEAAGVAAGQHPCVAWGLRVRQAGGELRAVAGGAFNGYCAGFRPGVVVVWRESHGDGGWCE